MLLNGDRSEHRAKLFLSINDLTLMISLAESLALAAASVGDNGCM
jgi:hypothetical protein